MRAVKIGLLLISLFSNLEGYTSNPVTDDDQGCIALAKAFPQLQSTDGTFCMNCLIIIQCLIGMANPYHFSYESLT